MELHHYDRAYYSLIALVIGKRYLVVCLTCLFTSCWVKLHHCSVVTAAYLRLVYSLHFANLACYFSSISSCSVLFPPSFKISLPFTLHLLSHESDNQYFIVSWFIVPTMFGVPLIYVTWLIVPTIFGHVIYNGVLSCDGKVSRLYPYIFVHG